MRSPQRILSLHERLVDDAKAAFAEKSERTRSIEGAMQQMRSAMDAEFASDLANAPDGRARAVAYWRSGTELLKRLESALDDAKAAESDAREALLAAFEEKERLARYAERAAATRKKAAARQAQNEAWDRLAIMNKTGPALDV